MNDQQIQEKVRQIILQNSVSGHDKNKKKYHYIKPSKKRYPNQYFWDTCFHAFILTALGEYELARQNIRSLFSLQSENGFVGHIMYWNDYLPHHLVLPPRITDILQNKISLKSRLLAPHMSALIQPPLIAHAIHHLHQADPDRNFLKEMLPKLKKYYHYLAKNRDLDNTGLLTTITPFESGMDWKPTYDPVVGFRHRKASWKLFKKVVSVDFHNFIHNYDLKAIYENEKFLVKDVGLNTIYVENLRALSDLCKIMDDPESGHFLQLAKKVTQSMINIMYDEEKAAFLDVYGKRNKKINILSASIFFPLVIEEMDSAIDDAIIRKHFFNKEEFHTPYPIPSLAINDPAFYPKASMYIWRGPTWVVFNWYIHKYFLKKGYEKEANHLISCVKKVIDKSGFREYYNPFTGEGYGAYGFTWAGLIIDMINKEKGKVPVDV